MVTRLVSTATHVAWVACLALAAPACSRASNEGEAKQWSSGEPAKDVEIPAVVAIDIKIDGTPRGAITAETLRGKKPDFADSERKAWMIPTLVAEAAPAGSVVEAFSPSGVSVTFAHPTVDGLEPVLFLTRRGELVVSAVDPKEPFPRFHGQGGRLHRAGDSTPRVNPVVRIEITHKP